MKDFFSVDMGEFLSALQVAINSKILLMGCNPKVVSLSFSEKPFHDEQWNYFEQLTKGEWKETKNVFMYEFTEGPFNLANLSQFLLLTRLRKENMLKLAELDTRYKNYVSQIFGKVENTSIQEVVKLDEAIHFVFSEMEKKKLTIRELAHQTGLSMVSISNFKAGKDIRLSNFLKIIAALKMRMKLE